MAEEKKKAKNKDEGDERVSVENIKTGVVQSGVYLLLFFNARTHTYTATRKRISLRLHCTKEAEFAKVSGRAPGWSVTHSGEGPYLIVLLCF